MVVLIVLMAVFIACAMACYAIALRWRMNPVLWVIMGLLFGPFAVAIALLKTPSAKKDGD